MKTIGLCTVRNEADIVGESLTYAARWLDVVYVLDCGSSDGTPALVAKLSQAHPNLQFLGAFGPRYAEQVRRHVWAALRTRHASDDWWIIQDADEFYCDDSRAVLEASARRGADHILACMANFYFTSEEYARWGERPTSVRDRSRSIAEDRRIYRMHVAMVRAFRNAPWMVWDRDSAFPSTLSVPSPLRFTIRHYQYRDPDQIAMRVAMRRSLRLTPEMRAENPHWLRNDIAQCISAAGDTSLHHWDGGEFQADPALPAVPKQSWAKSKLKLARAVFRRLRTPREIPAPWFNIE